MPIAIPRSGNGPGERWPWRPNSSISTICSRSPTRALATSPRRRRACASGTCTCASAIWRRRKASIIGLDPARRRSGASFLSSGRYHHHLGMNVWQSAGAGRRSVAVTILDPSAAPTANRTGATGVGGGQISGTIFLRTGGPGSYAKNSELNPKSPHRLQVLDVSCPTSAFGGKADVALTIGGPIGDMGRSPAFCVAPGLDLA
jgi:hypothetical protein